MFFLLFNFLFKLPLKTMYFLYDYFHYLYFKQYKEFNWWGIHLYTGLFGTGKTSSMIYKAYSICKKYPQVEILTNINITNFPDTTKIKKLNTYEDILNCSNNTVILIDEIGTIFNNRDFMKGNTIPKYIMQYICQCRKKHIVILGTVQKFHLLDKSIRDLSADVTVCSPVGRFPFLRKVKLYTYDCVEYERHINNDNYSLKPIEKHCYIQKNLYRNLYDTSEIIDTTVESLQNKYVSDDENVKSQGNVSPSNFSNKNRYKGSKFNKY